MNESTTHKKNIQIKNLNFFYQENQALFDLNFNIPTNKVTALIGPSGCGKSTFLRTINRMNDLIDGTRSNGEILIDNQNILSENTDVVSLRKKIGMVFQKSNPFPKSIFDNIAYGPKIHGIKNKSELSDIVEKALQDSGLWNEVKDKLNKSAFGLSGGQQQRMCIARALAINPEILLMDEPTSALDPKSTAIVEDLIDKLKESYTIIIVTHNMQQASRVSDKTAFFFEGELIEFNDTETIFTNPTVQQTENYITGRFG